MSQFDSTTIPSDLLEAVLNDPNKRKFILKLLNKTKLSIETSSKTPKQQCESPVALHRRRALEKLNNNTSDASSECSSTDSDLAPPPGPKTPHEKLLEGVVAFVDVRRDNVDKSAGIRLVMESMGAVIKDKLSKGVTHVVFKDADFTTYHAARLLNCHIVSVLWLDAIRKRGYRVPEKNYPAFGGEDNNASVLCSQIQKEFDDIIKEEKRRSYDVRKTSTQKEKKQRRTSLAPISSKSSYGSAKSSTKDSSKTNSEVADILSNLPSTCFVQISSPEVTSDDSDCGVVNGHTSSHLKEKFNCIETDRSMNTNTSTTPTADISSNQSKSLISGKIVAKSPRTNTTVPNIEISDATKTISTDKSTNISSTRCTRSSSRSKSRSNLDNSTDIVSQTPSKNRETNHSTNISSARNSRNSTRSKLGSNLDNSTDIVSQTPSNNKETNKSTNISSSRNRTRSMTRNNLNILSDVVLQIPSKISNVETLDRTKTISTEKSLNVSTNKSSNKNSTLQTSCGTTENEDVGTSMSSLRLFSSTDKENSELLANLNDNQQLIKTIDDNIGNEPKVMKSRRHLFSPGKVVCTPKDDEIERAERIKAVEAKIKILQKTHLNDDNNNNSKGEKRKRNKNCDKIDDDINDNVEKGQSINLRRSQRLSITPKPTSNNKNIVNNNFRRSSLEFENSTEKRKKPRIRIDSTKAPSIVCTRFHRYEVQEFIKIVKQLGVFHVEQQVTKKTTHLIAGESKRTINMLRAISRGCWILKREWLDKSLEHGKWLPEEDYELTEFSPAVQHCRLERQAFGPNYTIDIFEGCGRIFVANNTTPRQDELKELIEICKGQLTNVYRNADIVVGQLIRSSNLCCVTEMWVLDSIMENKLKSFRKYLIKTDDSPHF